MSISVMSTFHRSQLLVNATTGVLCHGQVGDPNYIRTYIWQSTGRPYWFFVIPDQHIECPIGLQGDLDVGRIVSLFGFEAEGSGYYFRHPLSGFVLSAVERTGAYGEVVANREQPKEWEIFRLKAATSIPDYVLSEVACLESIIASFDSGQKILTYLRDWQDVRAIGRLGVCLRLLPVDQIEWLGRAIVSEPMAVSNLAALMPNDLWANKALPALLRHRAGQDREGSTREVDATLGHLATSAVWGKYVSSSQMLNSFARRAIPAEKGICVVAAARNEGLYFLEWIAYHRAIGVDAFFIYTNDNDDGSDSLLSALAHAGIITWITINTVPDINPQHMAYGHAFQIMPDLLDYRWAAIIDLDEFIVLDARRFSNLPDFLGSHEWRKTDAIALSWVMFGPDQQTRKSNLPVTRRFVTRDVAVHPLIKSISRPCMFTHSRCHNPIWDDFTAIAYRNALGAPHPQKVAGDVSAFATEPTDQFAWINHYYCKSAEEYLLRRAKSPPERLTRTPSGAFFSAELAQNFANIFERQDLPRDERIFESVPDLEREIDVLRRLPGVDKAVRAIEANYAKRVKRLSSILADDPRFNVPDSVERWFAGIIS